MADKVYDLAQLEELAGGSQEFIMSMVDTFLEHTPGQVEQIDQAHKSGDLTTVGGIAHKIKPNIDLFGISVLTGTIREIEQMGKAGEDSPKLADLIAELLSVTKVAFKQLEDLKNA